MRRQRKLDEKAAKSIKHVLKDRPAAERRSPKSAPTVKSVLYSTTRSWNIGDDFILFGVRNLVDQVLPGHNPIIYNRNPDLHQQRVRPIKVATKDGTFPIDLVSTGVFWRFDNSWRPPHSLAGIDYCIYAGSPEWMGSMTEPLSAALLSTDTPSALIGIGVHEGTRDLSFDNMPDIDKAVIRRSSPIIVRDPDCARNLSPVSPVELPCPALFASKTHRLREKKTKIALSGQGLARTNGQRVDQSVFYYTLDLFRALSKAYDCTLVCHYIEDYMEFHPLLGADIPMVISYDPKDYLEIYDGFDLTVTTRVHGAGMCASLGVPSFIISHSARSGTAAGFLADSVELEKTPVEEFVSRIDDFDVAGRSEQLLAHKQDVLAKYLPYLEEFFGCRRLSAIA